MYSYLTVRSDGHYAGSVPASALAAYLESQPGLRRTDLACFRAEDGREWLHAAIAECDPAGNYAVREGMLPERANSVELVSASDRPAREAALTLARGIADRLGWEVTDAETGEIVHRPPAEG
ncbi:hypothetical protein [Streptomyces sp. NPDC096132]|uniref:hypothetical protein n=1 Tax=Streptomyces sp. NPDC096132 TaxID=3366075 RepID=UPI00380972FF